MFQYQIDKIIKFYSDQCNENSVLTFGNIILSWIHSQYVIVFLTTILEKASIKFHNNTPLSNFVRKEEQIQRRGLEDQFSISFAQTKENASLSSQRQLALSVILFLHNNWKMASINLSLSSKSSYAEISPMLYFLFDPSLINIIFSLVCTLQTVF